VKRNFEQVKAGGGCADRPFAADSAGKCPAGMPNRFLFGLSVKTLRFLDKPGYSLFSSFAGTL
jgi:hypothetical protein